MENRIWKSKLCLDPDSDFRVVCSWQGTIRLPNSRAIINNIVFIVFRILQRQSKPGIGYIDADQKVSMIQIGLILDS